MHIDRRFLGWGVFLLVVGAVPLLVRSGTLSTSQVQTWWSFWPLILVGIGLGLVLRRTALEPLGGVLVAATFGLMAGSFLAAGPAFGANACGDPARSVAFQTSTGTFTGPSRVSIRLDCGSVSVQSAPGSAWTFDGSSDPDHPPIVDAGPTSLSLRTESRFSGFTNGRPSWRATLPEDVPTDLSLQLNAGQATLGLGPVALEALDVQVNAGSVAIDLARAKALDRIRAQANAGSIAVSLPNVSTSGSIEANLGSIKLCAPEGAGLRLTAGGALGSNDFGSRGMQQDGAVWTTAGYATAPVKIDLRVQANLGSISLKPERGCGE